MNIQSTHLKVSSALQAPALRSPSPGPEKPEIPHDSFSFSSLPGTRSILSSVAGMAIGAGVGAYAGMNTGTLAGVGGAALGVLPGAVAGGLGAALLAESQGRDNASVIVGAGVMGLIGGSVVGAAGTALLASQVGGVGAAIGLGIAGGITGLLVGGRG